MKTRFTSTTLIAAITLLGLGIGSAFAGDGNLSLAGPTSGQSVLTSRGPAFVTGNLGSLATTTLPGSGGQGLLMNNGNGTSTLLTTGGIPQTVATPR